MYGVAKRQQFEMLSRLNTVQSTEQAGSNAGTPKAKVANESKHMSSNASPADFGNAQAIEQCSIA